MWLVIGPVMLVSQNIKENIAEDEVVQLLMCWQLVVIGTGNPWVFLGLPIPLPVKTLTLPWGYVFLVDMGISKTWASSFGSSSHGRWSFEHLFESLSHSRNLSWSLSIFRSLAFHNEASYTYLSYYIYTIQHGHSLVFPHCNHRCCNQISCLQCGQ